MSKKYGCRIEGSITVEASSIEEAREKASEMDMLSWDWERVEVEGEEDE